MGLSGDQRLNIKEVEEGAEPAEFWSAIGSQDRKSYDCMLQGKSLKITCIIPLDALMRYIIYNVFCSFQILGSIPLPPAFFT